MKSGRWFALFALLFALAAPASAGWDDWFSLGLNKKAKRELWRAGVTKYLGDFEPTSYEDAGDGWVRFRFDLDQHKADGPICINGTEYSVFAKQKNPRKLLIFLQGGGACWKGFYFCNRGIDNPLQMPPPPPVGLWSDGGLDVPGIGNIPNPLADYSIVFLPYCDGSVFTGDNDVVDPDWPFSELRHHRGLKNLSAGMDIAKDLFPRPRRIMIAGSSAGGVGVASFAPFLARFKFGNFRDIAVFNDAGPNAINLMDLVGIAARASDWAFGQFFPASCTGCGVDRQGTEIVKWRLANDRTIREAFYSTDGDETNRGFLFVPSQELYRELILSVHGEINAAFPFRYKRFIQSGSTTHTALQTPLLYIGTAAGIPLNLWVTDFKEPFLSRWIKALREGRIPLWVDAVDDFVPAADP